MESTSAPPPNETFRRCFWRPIAFTLGLVAILGAFYAIGYERYESPQVKSDRKNLSRLSTRNAVVFGNSHGFNVLPKDTGLEGVNLCHGGQDLFEMAYMARAVKRAAPHVETVIFVISYFAFAFDNAAYTERSVQTRIGRRLVMYSAFPSFEFIEGDASSYVKGLLYPVVTRDHWKSVFYPGGSPREAFPEASDLPPNPKRDKLVASERSLATNALRRCQEYSKLMRKMTANHPGLEADAYQELRDVSRELESAGVRVVLVTPPYFETYNACFEPKRQASTRRLAQRIASETGAEYIDASSEREFTSKREFFRNSDHMNGNGKINFSRWLGRRLSGAGVP